MVVNTFSFVPPRQSLRTDRQWKVEITSPTTNIGCCAFDAQNDGKGTLTITDPQSKVWTGTQPSEAKWTAGEELRDVLWSSGVSNRQCGARRGNVDVQRKIWNCRLITGEAEFSPLVEMGPRNSARSKPFVKRSSAASPLPSERGQHPPAALTAEVN